MGILKIHYFETYYHANIINNLLDDPFNYIRGLSEFWIEDRSLDLIKPFQKKSILHKFIEFSIDKIHHEDLLQIDIEKIRKGKENLWVEVGFEHYNLDYFTFDEYINDQGIKREEIEHDHISEYIDEILLCGPYEDLLEILGEEIFFILFQNRVLLTKLNQLLATVLNLGDFDFEEEDYKEYKTYLTESGKVKRSDLPEWVKRAVFYRDRGKCVICHMDLTRMISIDNVLNYDHIVPLADGGLNDVTNIQLLCVECNKSKHTDIITSHIYERWY